MEKLSKKKKKVRDCIIADHNADICVLCGSSDDMSDQIVVFGDGDRDAVGVDFLEGVGADKSPYSSRG